MATFLVTAQHGMQTLGLCGGSTQSPDAERLLAEGWEAQHLTPAAASPAGFAGLKGFTSLSFPGVFPRVTTMAVACVQMVIFK